MKTFYKGIRAAQTDTAIATWSALLDQYGFAQIIEIGTYRGGMSMFLLDKALEKEALFRTYDIKDLRNPAFIKPCGEHNCFMKRDCFEFEDEVGTFVKRPGRTFLFCDGGNKEREFNTFSKYLKMGDIIAVHDWGTETHRENLNLNGLEELVTKDSMTRFFIKNA